MHRLSIVACAALSVAGCGGEAVKDATKSGQTVDRRPAEVIAFPDGFRNVASKCDGHGHRVYSSSSGQSGTYPNLAVIDDPDCPGGAAR